MLDPVAHVAKAVRLTRRLIAVNRGAHRPVPNRMHGDLQAALVDGKPVNRFAGNIDAVGHGEVKGRTDATGGR